MGTYVEKGIIEPFEEDDDQDMWIGLISYVTSEIGDVPHEEVIEVRAVDEQLLEKRMSSILSALNFNKGARGL